LLRARDPAAAQRAVEGFAARVAREFGPGPSAALRALADEVRTTLASAPRASAPRAEPPASVAAADVDVPVLAVDAVATLDPRTAPVAPGRVAPERPAGWRVTRWRTVVVGGAVACIAAALGTAAGTRAIAPDATRELEPAPAARGLYEEGLRALTDRGDDAAALPLFQAALRIDSSCAPCAYQAAATIGARAGRVTPSPELTVAERLAARAAPVDRLRIRYWLAAYRDEPARVALAESVLALRPADPEAEVAVGSSLAHAGAYAAALPHLRRVLALDSFGLRRGGARCAACDAEWALVADYWAMDSLPTAEREAEAWVQAQSRSALAWDALAETFEREGRFDVARDAQARRVAVQGGAANDLVDHMRMALRAGEFAEAERVLQALREEDNADTRVGALWFLIILRRDEGRLREALDLARQFAELPDSQDQPGMPGTGEFPAAQVLFELGRWREAAVRWRALARVDTAYARVLPGEAARRRTWMLAQLATALGAAGDVGALVPLVDSVERASAGSAYGRDHVLGQYVRGLVAEQAGNLPAAEHAFRRAILSPTEGYTRVNVALARVLLAEGRAAEVPAILRPAFAGSVEASNYYVTRPELHEWLARAFDATGARDSAAAHWARVAAAWRDADPPLRARAAVARARLHALTDRPAGAARRRALRPRAHSAAVRRSCCSPQGGRGSRGSFVRVPARAP
ncbi:MAG TPA: hypothetical protein VGD56_10205, partial [Gemmatirosa sp.]